LKRIFAKFAYGDGPRANCWWDQTCAVDPRPALEGDARCDVAIVRGGFTGLSAALHLAKAGVSVTVLESCYIGFGASGRNGGFCCLGGGRLSDAAIERAYGVQGRQEYRAAELAAIDLVERVTRDHEIDIDRHSDGETELAHRPKDMDRLRNRVAEVERSYGLSATVIEKGALADHGLNGPFHGALTIPVGFALNPRKYVTGLARAAAAGGAVIYHDSPVQSIEGTEGRFRLSTARGALHADRVIVATNGYSSEDLPDWLAGRYMPAQSSVIVTRPLTEDELAAQGWTSDQMVYDTRNLLHYFRLMPDGRMLFGMRGGLMTGAAADRRAIGRARRDFETMFPAWRHVETPFGWSGMVCIARDQMPFVGPVPQRPGMFAGLCYHGNGVAMGSYAGALLADLVQDRRPDRPYSAIMQRPLSRFGLGRVRRVIMPLAYAGFALADR
jgi:glycine/D-amino acid oxidase-like deaminating enzyme